MENSLGQNKTASGKIRLFWGLLIIDTMHNMFSRRNKNYKIKNKIHRYEVRLGNSSNLNIITVNST